MLWPTLLGGMETMDKRYVTTAYENWVESVRSLTQTNQTALAYREMRSTVAAAIATVILRASTGGTPNPDDERFGAQRVVYGVWLVGHEPEFPIYIGQTSERGRRLWDLPIGESHHLANTFPPEIWSHVVVVRWPEVLRAYGNDIGIRSLDPDSIGFALEYALQRQFSPPMNTWRKNRDGTLAPVRLSASRSVGVVVASSADFQGFFRCFLEVWSGLRNCESGHSEWETRDYGGVAFPSRVYDRVLGDHGFV